MQLILVGSQIGMRQIYGYFQMFAIKLGSDRPSMVVARLSDAKRTGDGTHAGLAVRCSGGQAARVGPQGRCAGLPRLGGGFGDFVDHEHERHEMDGGS